jgi:hypothetical protein
VIHHLVIQGSIVWLDKKTLAEMVNPLAETYLNEANKLDGSNFINWKFKMQTLMEGYGVWTIVKGTEEKPDAVVSATTTQIQDWDKHENKAKVLLHMSVKDSIIPHIREAKLLLKHGQCLKHCMKLATQITFCS